jgi:hypothetical protein
MKSYLVTYTGNASRYQNFKKEVFANSEKEALINTVGDRIDLFPQEDGSIRDVDGHMVAGADDDMIEYDGGYFSAEEIADDDEE